MAEIVIDAKCPKLPQRPYFHYIRENVSHRSYEATCCIKFAVLEAHWVKVNSIVLAFRYPSSLQNKTKKSKECPKLPWFTLVFLQRIPLFQRRLEPQYFRIQLKRCGLAIRCKVMANQVKFEDSVKGRPLNFEFLFNMVQSRGRN